MKLTIVETGLAPETLRAGFPDYPDMFRRLIGPAAPEMTFETVSLVKGEALPDPAGLDGVLITGSPAGVYDPEVWMSELMDFIRWTAAEQTPLIGVCFGHQAIAQALGGQVRKSEKGWGVGRHRYDFVATPKWLGAAPPEHFSLAVSHQDQVVVLPPGARTVAVSEFTPFAALHFDSAPIISVQGHPEFDDDFARALFEIRRDRLGDELTDTAIQSLHQPENNKSVGRWFANFLTEAAR